MSELKHDYDGTPIMECGVFTVFYVLEEDDGYHIEIWADGNEVIKTYPAFCIWTLDEAVENSKLELEEFVNDAVGLLGMLKDLDMEKVKKASAVTKVKEEE